MDISDNIDNIDNIDNTILYELINKVDILEEKLDSIIKILNNDIKTNTEKMGSHIDFIENIYENVKSPLGFFCNKINYFRNNDNTVYTLENKN